MKSRKARALFPAVGLIVLMLAACGAAAPSPTAIPPTVAEVAQEPTATSTPVPPTATHTLVPPTDTPTLTPTATETPTSVPPTDTSTPTITPTSTETPTLPPPTATATKKPPTRTPKPPTPTPIPLLPTPVDWAAVDWTEIARILLRSAKVYRPQMVEAKVLLNQDPTNCPRLAYLLDSLAAAPQYKEVNQLLWDRRNLGGMEGRLWSYRDAYADGVNRFNLDFFRIVSAACAAGNQPTAEQRQAALKWIDEPISKMVEVISALDPVVGP